MLISRKKLLRVSGSYYPELFQRTGHRGDTWQKKVEVEVQVEKEFAIETLLTLTLALTLG